MSGNSTVLVRPTSMRHNSQPSPDDEKSFTFDHSYWSFDNTDVNYASQSIVFNDLGLEVLHNAWEGFNCSIFAYGQTGSGKSYSMLGYGEEKGIIPLVCEELFKRIDSTMMNQTAGGETIFKVEVSFMEIYNERVKDLLNPKNNKSAGGLKVRNNPSTGPYVEDLSKLAVKSFQEIEMLMDEGTKARTVASTNMNATSSRSHAVFTIVFTQSKVDKTRGITVDRVSKISLVDLAGSERATSTGATGVRLKEGANINKSLSTLGKVISALAENSTPSPGKKQVFVPYRDSVLTYLLKESLGGNSKTIMIAAISPADINFEETLSTLRYADSAKKIKTTAIVNEDPQTKAIRELQTEVERLKSLLGSGVAGVAIGSGPSGSNPSASTDHNGRMTHGVTNDEDGLVVSLNEKIEQYEKLMTEMNKTWEERLSDAEKIRGERKAALKDMGVAIKVVSSIPHLINLNEDPLMSESLMYYLKEGDTRIGRSDAESQQDIILNGLNIAKEHCIIEYKEGIVTIAPASDRKHSSIFVNGVEINAPTVLSTGNRVVLGNNHIFRFNHPEEAAKLVRERSNSFGGGAPPKPDFGLDLSLEAEPTTPRGGQSGHARRAPDNQVIDYNFALNELASAQGNLAMMKHDMDREFQRQMKILYDQMRSRLELDFNPETKERRDKLALFTIRRWRSKVNKTRLLNQISHVLLSVNEANAISEALSKNIDLSVTLQCPPPLMAQDDGSGTKVIDDSGVMEVDWKSTQIVIRATNKDTGEETIISKEEFIDRLYSMRDLYQNDGWMEEEGEDPFTFKFDEVNYIGVAHLYLMSVLHLPETSRSLPILDTFTGAFKGHLNVVLGTRVDGLNSSIKSIFVGKPITIGIQLDGITDFVHDVDSYVDVFVKCNFNSVQYQSNIHLTVQQMKDRIDLEIECLEEDLIKELETQHIALEVFGKRMGKPINGLDDASYNKAEESIEFIASVNILEPESVSPSQSRPKTFKPVHILEESDTSNNMPSVTFRLLRDATQRQIMLRLFKSEHQTRSINIKACQSVNISDARIISKRDSTSGLAMMSPSSSPSPMSRYPTSPGRPPTNPSLLNVSQSSTTGTSSPVLQGQGSGASSDPVELPVVSATHDTVVAHWDYDEPAHLFSQKTMRKGSRILFKVTFVLEIEDFEEPVTISKEVSAKVLLGMDTWQQQSMAPDGAAVNSTSSSSSSSLNNLMEKFKTHFKGESILSLDQDSDSSSILHSGSVFNVHLTKSQQIEHQNRIGDMIDSYQEHYMKLGASIKIERLRQQLDLRQKLADSDNSPNHPTPMGGDNSPGGGLPEEIVKRMSSNANNARTSFARRTRSFPSLIEVKVNEIGASALVKQEDDISGVLMKKSTYRDEWRQYHFVLKKPYLYYSHINEKEDNKGTKKIELTNASIATIPQDEVAFGLAIIQLRRVWLLKTTSTEDRDRWVKALDPSLKISERKDQELQRAKQLNDLLKRDLQRATEERDRLSMQLVELSTKQLDVVENVEIGQLTTHINSMTTLMERLNQQSRQYKNVSEMELSTLRQEVLSLRESNHGLVTKLGESKDMTLALENDRRQLEDKVSHYRQMLDSNTAVAQYQTRNINSMREESKAKQGQIDGLTLTVEESLKRIKDITDQVSSSAHVDIAADSRGSPQPTMHEQAEDEQLEAMRRQLQASEDNNNALKEQFETETRRVREQLELRFAREQDQLIERLKKEMEESGRMKDIVGRMKEKLIEVESQLIDRECENTILSDRLRMSEEESRITGSRLGLLENGFKEVRSEYETGMAFSRELDLSAANKTLSTSRARTKALTPDEQMDNLRETSIAHQTQNAFLNLQLQRVEKEMKQQERVYNDTIQRIREDLNARSQQNISLVKKQAGATGGGESSVLAKRLDELTATFEVLKKKYFFNLVVSTKLQSVMMGNNCNVDSYDLYDQAVHEHIIDFESWPIWIANKFKSSP
ncbi:hypothetical protein SAMD00019534_115670 [Acytostelium subglobosum LB1]|uniref:hypothetical protein n=1 Tax=Acytostelium subglobosum LB1 TaxID=1410327 RepID=UPI000644BEB9|nr:hypothetical protein SAMD00019534_115670 [Acytostelium subglobosum LB1]GAM28391.1 hypothetical protein SAMD00019534_115670 [Acytostelium subglobosum LB1]|eukprot:XP_012748708.1 hypothetical protein SAMD00019534_115670 [Acytostelium subglobosum LB1]